jgi:hypothetical protein
MTVNLSESGLFIASEYLVRPGERITVDLRMPGLHERLEGEVIWNRQTHSPGRPIGMAIRLLGPSLDYRSRIQGLR